MNTRIFSKLGLLCCVFTCGCEVLTQPQVDAVKQFSTATQNYGQYPGQVIRDFRDVELCRRTLFVVQNRQADAAKRDIASLLKQKQAWSDEADRADAALAILDNYSKMLSLLVSDSYTQALDTSATELAKNLDAGITAYNKKFGAAAPMSIGGDVAAAVRALGGIAIRHEQAVAVRKAIANGDKLVEEMTDAVAGIADLFTPAGSGPNPKSPFDIEMAKLVDTLAESIHLSRDDGRFLDVAYVDRALAALELGTQGKATALAAVKAAKSYRAAHKKLTEAIKPRAGVEGFLAEIKTFQNELQAADKIRKASTKPTTQPTTGPATAPSAQ